MVETSVAIGLAVAPRIGLIGGGALFAIYTLSASMMSDGVPCYCFGRPSQFAATRTERLVRNTTLTLIAITALAASNLVGARTAAVGAIASAGVAFLLAFSLDAFIRVSRRLSFLQMHASLTPQSFTAVPQVKG